MRHLPGSIAVAIVTVAAVLGVRAQTGTAPARDVTFSEDIAPIIFTHCTSCHRPGEAAPFPLQSYADVRPRGRLIATSTRARQMPPWKADTGDFAFQGDRRLSDAQIDVIERWVNGGMLQGDPSKQPPLPRFTDGWQLGEPDLIVRMPEAYAVPEKGRDIYRNFVLPLDLKEDVWVRGVDFRPSARSAVHHSLFFLDATGTARQQDERDPLPGYSGGMGGGLTLGGGRLSLAAGRGGRSAAGGGRGSSAAGTTLGGWAPGAQPRLLPDDLAFFVPKGSDLILSTHFHPSGKAESEASTVGLYFAKTPPTKAFTAVQLPPVFGLLSGIDIPAGDTTFSISDSFVLPVDVKAFGASAHAHYLGKTMRMTATLPNGDKKTLLSIHDWDFGWQEQYLFANYVTLPKGTKLDVTVTYDNSAANRRNPSNPPQRVTWGEQSTDEMGSVTLQAIAAHQGELPELQQALADHIREVAVNSPLGRLLLGGRGAPGR